MRAPAEEATGNIRIHGLNDFHTFVILISVTSSDKLKSPYT
jgi:hypothetical protein